MLSKTLTNFVNSNIYSLMFVKIFVVENLLYIIYLYGTCSVVISLVCDMALHLFWADEQLR